MKKRVVSLIFSLLCLLGVLQAEGAEHEKRPTQLPFCLQQRFIDSFHKNLGFIHSEEKDSLVVYGDSLVMELDKAGRYDQYFELERILIFSHILREETRVAIAQSERMYSKAKALGHVYGMALAMNAVGDVYMYVNRLHDSQRALKSALNLLKDPTPNGSLTKLLLLKLIDNSLHLGDRSDAKIYLERLNHYSKKELSSIELGVIYNYNAYYALQMKDVETARENLDKAWQLKSELRNGVIQHLLVTEASYYESIGNYDEALEMLEQFFKVPNPERNRGLYIDVMKNKAELLATMGAREEAFRQYEAVYAYVNATFKKNFPKEIDQLTTRFQADALAFQNERARNSSILYYIIGIVICVVVLLFLLLWGWRKIFKLRESKKKQEEMKQKAENAIRKKNLFLSNMSHEVRTPLNAIVGFSTLLSSEDGTDMDEASRKEAGEIIKVNSRQLLKLINDILDLSDFEEDNIQFHFNQHDAVKICNEVIETIKASYQLQVDLCFETPFTSLSLETDDARLRQVLINLLVNAIKFTKHGSIWLRLEQAGDEAVQFSVTDTGCGIPPEKQRLIFERFEKLNEFVQGTGLGLSICQLIVKYVGGKIWIDSEYMKGARFCFTHPLQFKSTLTNTRQ